MHYYNSEQLAAVHIKRQRKSCLMTKTDSRLQIWTSWCIPARNMKDRKYLTCAAFGKQEKIWRSGMALLCLLINLFLIVSFFFSFLFPPEQRGDEAALLPAAQRWSLPARRMGPSARLSAAVHHPARAEVGLAVTLSTALGQATDNVHLWSPGMVQQAAAGRDGPGAVCHWWHWLACPNSI